MNKEENNNLNLYIVILTCFINGSLASGMVPVLNLVLGERSATAFSAYFVGSVLGLSLIYFSKFLRTLKHGLVIYQSAFALSFVLMALRLDSYGLHIGRFLEGLSGGLLLPLAFGWICRNSPYEKLGTRASALNTAFALGFVAGPAFVELGIENFTLQKVVLYLTLPVLCTLVFLTRIDSETDEPNRVEHYSGTFYEWWDRFYYLIFAKLVYGFIIAYLTSYATHIVPDYSLRSILLGIVGLFIVGQILAHLLKNVLESHLVLANLLLAMSFYALYLFFWKITVPNFIVFVVFQSIIVFVAYKKLAVSPNSSRAFALYNALTDPGLILGSLLASFGDIGFLGIAFAGTLATLVFLIRSARHFRAEAEYPPFGIFAIAKMLRKQKILNRDIEPSLHTKNLSFHWSSPAQDQKKKIRLAFSGDFATVSRVPSLDDGINTLLASCDYRFLNLEGPYASEKSSGFLNKWNVFGISREQFHSATKKGQYNILNLVNNHILDKGRKAVDQTLDFIKQNNLHAITSSASFLKHEGISLGFLGLSFECNMFVLNHPQITRIRPHEFMQKTKLAEMFLEKIRDTKKQCDFLILSYHWGFESEFAPSTVQQQCARLFFSEGVDLIYGHHSHIVQPFEVMDGKLVLYSCGNFAMEEKKREYLEGVIFIAEYGISDFLNLQKVETHSLCYSEGRISLMPSQESLAFQFWKKTLPFALAKDTRDYPFVELPKPVES